MKSIKPGRGPSFMSGIGSVAVSIFGVFWTVMAVSIDAPVFFPIFGGMFVLLGIATAIYNFRNASAKNRYSAFDITEGHEEPDPLNKYFTNSGGQTDGTRPGGFCPYCGNATGADHSFCKRCGKRVD